jgi:hypothetical protein
MSGAVASRVPTVKMILVLERAIVDTEMLHVVRPE